MNETNSINDNYPKDEKNPLGRYLLIVVVGHAFLRAPALEWPPHARW